MPFNSFGELHQKIQNINNQYYSKIQENCFFLEEANQTTYIIFMREIRDAYSHLAIIYQYTDITNNEISDKITEHLIKFEGHLQRLLLESYKMICEYYLRIVKKKYKKSTSQSILYEVAKMVKDCRLNTSQISFIEKINGYENIISEYEKILKNKNLK